MSFVITGSTTKKDFERDFKIKSKEKLNEKFIREIQKYEDKYNMKSAFFYKKYTNNELNYKRGFEDWYAKIKMYANYSNTVPEKVKINR